MDEKNWHKRQTWGWSRKISYNVIEWLNFEYLDYDIKSRAGLVFVFEYLGYWSYEDGGPKILKSA